MTVSQEEHPDLFLSAASAFSTLRIVTLVEITLLEAKPYMALTYHPVAGVLEAIEKIE